MKRIKIVSTKNFDSLNLDELEDELDGLGFKANFKFCDDGLLRLTLSSNPNPLLNAKSRHDGNRFGIKSCAECPYFDRLNDRDDGFCNKHNLIINRGEVYCKIKDLKTDEIFGDHD